MEMKGICDKCNMENDVILCGELLVCESCQEKLDFEADKAKERHLEECLDCRRGQGCGD